MHSLIAKVKRPLLAAAMLMGLGVGAASAVDYCSPVACQPVCPQPVAYANPCDPCSSPSPSYYQSGVSSSGMNYYSSSGSMNSGIHYLVPTMSGFVETTSVPITNEVDLYYATHRVANGQVVEAPVAVNRWI